MIFVIFDIICFFFKQKTAYEMRISDWSSDVCSSDLVVEPTRGRVAFAGEYRGYGRIVIIDHGNGWTTLLAHLDRLSVEVGSIVRQGDPIGTAGRDRPRVIVELRRNGRPMNIIPLMG